SGLPGQPGGPYPTPGPVPPGGGPSHGQLPSPPVEHLPPQAGQLPIYPATPSHPIALPPGVIWPPLGPQVPQGKALAVIFISGFGYRWTVIDTNLQIGMPLPGQPNVPGMPLPGQPPQVNPQTGQPYPR